MGTYAERNYFIRDGVRTDMTNGRDGRAEAAQTSPATDKTPTEIIEFAGKVSSINVATGDLNGRFGVNRPQGWPLNVVFKGQGKGSAESVLRGMLTGEKYSDGAIDRNRPAIYKLGWTDLTVDVRGIGGQYPIVTGQLTVMGSFIVRRCLVRSDGYTGKGVKTIFRSNARSRLVLTDIDAPDGANEYLVYGDFGAGRSIIKNIRAAGFARGVIQGVNRYFNVEGFGYPDDQIEAVLEIADIDAQNTGADGSSVVSLTTWGDTVYISDINCDTPWNTALISIRFDPKLCRVSGTGSGGSGGNWRILGRGRMPQDGFAHGMVSIDLSGNRIRTGRNQAGQAMLNGRAAIIADSCRDLWIASDDTTVVQAGHQYDERGELVATSPAVDLEINGDGPIKTYNGAEVVGTRRIESIRTVGGFGGWAGGMRRKMQPFSVDEYRSPRRDIPQLVSEP
jgi:hypothetical protein